MSWNLTRREEMALAAGERLAESFARNRPAMLTAEVDAAMDAICGDHNNLTFWALVGYLTALTRIQREQHGIQLQDAYRILGDVLTRHMAPADTEFTFERSDS